MTTTLIVQRPCYAHYTPNVETCFQCVSSVDASEVVHTTGVGDILRGHRGMARRHDSFTLEVLWNGWGGYCLYNREDFGTKIVRASQWQDGPKAGEPRPSSTPEVGTRWRYTGGLELMLRRGDIVAVRFLQHNGIVLELEGGGWSGRVHVEEFHGNFVPAEKRDTVPAPAPEAIPRCMHCKGETAERDHVALKAKFYEYVEALAKTTRERDALKTELVSRQAELKVASDLLDERDRNTECFLEFVKGEPELDSDMSAPDIGIAIIRRMRAERGQTLYVGPADAIAVSQQLARCLAENATLRARLETLEPIARRLGEDERQGRR